MAALHPERLSQAARSSVCSRSSRGSCPGSPSSSSAAAAAAGLIEAEEAPHRLEDVLCYGVLGFLDLKSACALRATTSLIRSDLRSCHACADSLALNKTHPLGSPSSTSILTDFGKGLLTLSLHKVPLLHAEAFSTALSLTPNIRKLTIHEVDYSAWDDVLAAQSMGRLAQLQELRLQVSDSQGERHPFSAIVREALPSMRALRKLTLFCKLSQAAGAALVSWLRDCHSNGASRRLLKLKLCTSLANGDAGVGILTAVATHTSLQKLTIARPDGHGEPLRAPQCALIGKAMAANTSLWSVHVRRCALWTVRRLGRMGGGCVIMMVQQALSSILTYPPPPPASPRPPTRA